MRRIHRVVSLILILSLCLILEDVNKTGTCSKKLFSSNVKYVGHRGISGLAPENTLLSLNLAGRLGYWGTEFDARTTNDGNWIVLHDDTVDRTTNGTGPVSGLSLESLQSLKITQADNIISCPLVKVPKLQDCLAVCKEWDMTAVVEMKPGDNFQYYDKFLEILKEYGDTEMIIVTSCSREVLNELRRRDSSLTLGLICHVIDDYNISYVKKIGNAYIECAYPNITKAIVNLCHKNNIEVGAWTIDDRALADKLIKAGVDIITTNKLLPGAFE